MMICLKTQSGRLPRVFACALLLAVASPAASQTLTVNKTTGPFFSIGSAVTALSPGGGSDDGDTTNNEIQITDNEVYVETIDVQGFGMTIDGTPGGRPIVVLGSGASNGVFHRPGPLNEHFVLRGLIFIPAVTFPAIQVMSFDTAVTGATAYHITLESVLIAPNDGSNQPTTLDGRTPPAGVAGTDYFPFIGNGINLSSTTGPAPSTVTMRRLVITGTGDGTGDRAIQLFTDFGTILFGEGCMFTFNGGRAVSYATSSLTGTTTAFNGTPAEPVIIHGNAGEAIFCNNISNDPQLTSLNYVCITSNASASTIAAVTTGTNAPGPPAVWSNVTIAGNIMSDGFSASSRQTLFRDDQIMATNCVFAGDNTQDITEKNLYGSVSGTPLITCNGVNVDTSGGATSLNLMAGPGGGVITGSSGLFMPTGAGITNLDPMIVSLDLTSPDYGRVGNPAFATLGPGGGPLTGCGPGGVPAATPTPGVSPTAPPTPTPPPSPSANPTPSPSPTPVTCATGTTRLFGVDSGAPSLYELNKSDGSILQTIPLSQTVHGVQSAQGLTTAPGTGTVYIVYRPTSGARRLGTIDIATGVITDIGSLGANFAAISFDSAGILWGITGNGAVPPETMFTINPADAATTQMFDLGPAADGECIAFNFCTNQMYRASGPQFSHIGPHELNVVDLGTGMQTPVLMNPGSGEITGMVHDPTTGQIWVTNGNFDTQTIEPMSGHVSQIGFYTPDNKFIRGLALVTQMSGVTPTATFVPTPSPSSTPAPTAQPSTTPSPTVPPGPTATPTACPNVITFTGNSPSLSGTCNPFGQGGTTYRGMVYKTEHQFSLVPGDLVAFDLQMPNDAPISMEVALAAAVAKGSTQPDGNGFTIVASGESASKLGDTTDGNYEVAFTVTNPFAFSGPTLIVRLRPLADFIDDATCTNVVFRTYDVTDSSDFFVASFRNDPDGQFPWTLEELDGISPMRVISSGCPPTPTPLPSATQTPPPVPSATPSPTPGGECCPGDANNSGSFVDANDFIAVQANFGADNGLGGPGDANCSGSFVDANDFIAVQANFGADCG